MHIKRLSLTGKPFLFKPLFGPGVYQLDINFNVYLSMPTNSTTRIPIIKVTEDDNAKTTDALAIEEPLEIRLEFGPADNRKTQNVSVTMRTPGNDAELAVGFLFTEGIIRQQSDTNSIEHCIIPCTENKENVIQVSLKNGVLPNLNNSERNFYTTSSCGVCGKASISSIRTVSSFSGKESVENQVRTDILYQLPSILQKHQEGFADTGGLHASALFNNLGELLLVREDVGRHNA